MAELKKGLSFWHIVFLTVGAIIGSGILIVPYFAASIAGTASFWVWLIVGIIAIGFSLIFAELISLLPKSGGIYSYAKKAFGEFWGFVIGWITWAAGWVTIAMLVSAGLDYLGAVLPIMAIPMSKYIAGIFIIGLLTLINTRAVTNSARFQIIFTSITFVSLLGLVLIGAPKIAVANFSGLTKLAFVPFAVAAAYIFEPFMGWDEATFLVEEAKSVRSTAKAVIAATVIVVGIYLSVVAVLLGVIGAANLNSTPLLQLSNVLLGSNGAMLFAVMAISIIIGSVNSWIVSLARLPYTMAREELLPSTFGKLNRHSVPQNALIFQFVFAALVFLALGGVFKSILEAMIPLALVIYLVVVCAYIKLRWKSVPDFDTKIARFLPLVIIPFIVFIFFSIHYEWTYFAVAAVAVLVSIPFFIQIKILKDREFLKKLHSHPLWLFKIGNRRRRLVKNMEFREDDYILDYGCGVGALALSLAKKVPRGRVLAIDIIHSKLHKLSARAKKSLSLRPNVAIVEEIDGTELPKNAFDKVICAGALNYMRSPLGTLVKLYDALKPGGKVAVAVSDSIFKPAPLKISDSAKLIEMLKSAGFKNISVDSEGGVFTTHYAYADK